jgi:hypothetical protein
VCDVVHVLCVAEENNENGFIYSNMLFFYYYLPRLSRLSLHFDFFSFFLSSCKISFFFHIFLFSKKKKRNTSKEKRMM